MAYNPKDYYFKKAKEQNFAARSVFKLEEIDQKFRILKTGQQVLDMGCAPGSWSQYASQKLGDSGRILGVDLTEVKIQLRNAIFIQADLRDLELSATFQQHGFSEKFDVVMSDMAPKTTGIRITDQARSAELCELAFMTAKTFLRPGGTFICKLFHSDDFTRFKNMIRVDYGQFEAMKPDSTRKISKEIFLIGLRKK